MREVYDVRIPEQLASLTLPPTVGTNAGGIARRIKVARDEPLFTKLVETSMEWAAIGKNYVLGWSVHRSYSKGELQSSEWLHLTIDRGFEPAGQECGTTYDEAAACDICGAGRVITSALRIKALAIPPKVEFAETIAGDEWLIASNVASLLAGEGLRGWATNDVTECNSDRSVGAWKQLLVKSVPVTVSARTVSGVSPFSAETGDEYRCPNGHTMGLNLLSELVIEGPPEANTDFALTAQYFGTKRGLLVPRRALLISQHAWRVLAKSNIRGYEVERVVIGV